jgi:dipeptidyl aminopeptidase/acylaminoacyl peptidase
MVHGGPTARTVPVLDPARQYWTTLGFAVLDLNYRGSSGYGRRYRQSLLGHWGEMDVEDIIDGIDYLIQQDRVDPGQVCIRGRSAGGYAVLRALTCYPDRFHAGACYFGIGNLVTLARTTHKFESRYIDRLLGEKFDPERALQPDSLFYRRSPVHYMDRLRSPVIVFQGKDDKVVPPKLSREIVRVLQLHNVAHEYVEYEGEGHGFRQTDTNVDALSRETAFFLKILGLSSSKGAQRG